MRVGETRTCPLAVVRCYPVSSVLHVISHQGMLLIQASVAFGNTQRYTHEVEVTTHLGSSSGVHRDFLGNVQSSDSAHRTDGWKGSGKCKKCAGTGKEPLPILTKNRRA